MIRKLLLSRKKNQTTPNNSSRIVQPSSLELKTHPRESWKIFFPWLQKKSHQSEHPSENSTESEKKPKQSILVLSLTLLLGSVIPVIISNPDKVQLWLTMLLPKPVAFLCEGITFQIPQNWQQLGCHSVALAPDATIIPGSFVSNESNSPKILLIVEDPYENDITLSTFYQKEKEQAQLFINTKKNTYFTENSKFQFKGDSDNYELVYDAGNIKRRDIGFLDRGKQYTIRYEASTQDFDKYEKEAREIINSLELDSVKEAK